MADSYVSPSITHNDWKERKFYCGVLEGFYGRPWTTDQRRTLFQRMQHMGMDTYLYAPKDDCKHRMYWRDLYSVEEAEHLKGLITEAMDHNVMFVYALSPGLDITYSSSKEVTLLKRKLEQVAEFGCRAFALLFDDIDVDMNESDKAIFSSFAQAQVAVTNEVYQYLGQPERFLFCPTEYCSSRAVPNIEDSEYLNTVGSRLLPNIDIFWTGHKVISKELTIEHIEKISKVFQRPPVIWDNIHANDYDQKRVFLGPYIGRSTHIISKLRGVLSNPNTEFEANYIAMHTLAQWAKSKNDGPADAILGSSPSQVTEAIRLETEGTDVEVSCPDSYRPREALINAVRDWLTELQRKLDAPSRKMALAAPPTIVPPEMPVAPVMNLCVQNESLMQPVSHAPVNSLVDPSSDSDGDSAAECVDMERMAPGISSAQTSGYDSGIADCSIHEQLLPMEPKSLTAATMSDVMADISDQSQGKVDFEDVLLIVEMFYLPFEHGSKPCELLNQLCWLKVFYNKGGDCTTSEWRQRAESFRQQLSTVIAAIDRFLRVPNRAIVQDLFPYVFDMKVNISLVESYVAWLSHGDDRRCWEPVTAGNPYTWCNKYYSDAFTSGDHEPWVFRGGLQAEFQRLLPFGAIGDLLLPPYPDVPCTLLFMARPFTLADTSELMEVYENCVQMDGSVFTSHTSHSMDPRQMMQALLKLCKNHCFVLENQTGDVCGFAVAALNAATFYKDAEALYPHKPEDTNASEVEMKCAPFYGSELLETRHPSLLAMCTLPVAQKDSFATRRLLAAVALTLRAHGSAGVHSPVATSNARLNREFANLKFYNTLIPGVPEDTALLGRVI